MKGYRMIVREYEPASTARPARVRLSCGHWRDVASLPAGYPCAIGDSVRCPHCAKKGKAARERHADDGYMTEADYQTWGRL